MSGGLIEPEGDDEILDFEPEALQFNAVMTGDLFESVAVAGEPQPAPVVVAGHPCTIRGASGRLRPRVACIRVGDHQAVPYRRWPAGHFGVFPISRAVGLGQVAADLQEWVTVDSSQLRREKRRLTLTERGVVILQQRVVHALTRVIVDPILLEQASAMCSARLNSSGTGWKGWRGRSRSMISSPTSHRSWTATAGVSSSRTAQVRPPCVGRCGQS